MQPLPAEAPDDDVVSVVARRPRTARYSVHSGVARHPDSTDHDSTEALPRSESGIRSPHPADVAQSVLFEAILLDEIDDLEDRAAVAERRWQRRTQRAVDAVVTLPHELQELRQRVSEARRLLGALRRRFPEDWPAS